MHPLVQHLLDVVAAPAPSPTPIVPREVNLNLDWVKNLLMAGVGGCLIIWSALKIINRGSRGDMSGATTRTAGVALGIFVMVLGASTVFLGIGDFFIRNLFN